MLAQTVLNNEILFDDVFSQSDCRISNPALVFQRAMKQIGVIYHHLETEYGVSFEEMEAFLAANESELVCKLNRLWNEVDCSIYDDYQNGVLEIKSFYHWKTTLEEWVKLFESAVRLFVYRQFNRLFEIPQKLTLKAA